MDAVTFEALYTDHAGDLRNSIRRIVRQSDQAEDILQEVFIRAWKNRENLAEVQNLRNWLTKIAVNLSINALRAQNRKRELLIDAGDTDEDNYAIQKALADFASPGPETELIRTSRLEAVRRMIADLPVEKREVLELVGQGDFTIRETSERLGIPHGTVKSRLHYGRRILSERFRDFLEE
jgi:RNA polymerase sigma-70 factor, ECF subfamily